MCSRSRLHALLVVLAAGVFPAASGSAQDAVPDTVPAVQQVPAPTPLPDQSDTPAGAEVPSQTAAPEPRPGADTLRTAAPAVPGDTQTEEAGEAPGDTTVGPAAPLAIRGEDAGLQAGDVDSLVAAVEERFRAYPLRDGVLLLPKYAAGVQSVEVAGGTIALDGRPASGGEIASRLRGDAALVLRLSYVAPAQLAERFAPAGAPPDTAPPAVSPTGRIAAADTAGTGGEGEPRPEREEEPEDADTQAEAPAEVPVPPGDLVRVGSEVRIAEDETVAGDLVVIGGDADVAGTVRGDAMSIGGVLRLRETARVHGDAVAVGGRVERSPGAEVHGETTSVGMAFPFVAGRGFASDGGGLLDALGGLLVSLLWIALLLILGAMFALFLRGPLERVEANVRSSPLKAGLVGFLAQVLFLPVYVIGLLLLVVTIIGIPLAVLWAVGFFVVGFVAALFGFTAVARAVAELFATRASHPLRSPAIEVLIGLLVLFAPILLGDLFSFGPGPMDAFAALLYIMGFLVLYLAFTAGFGAVILTRFGTRTSWSGEPPAPFGEPAAPPPAPPAGPPPAAPAPGGEPFPPLIPESPPTRLAGDAERPAEPAPLGAVRRNEPLPPV